MKNRTFHKGILTICKRLPQSRNGNSQYLAEIDGYTFRTKVDSSQAYSLPNYHNRFVCVTLGTHYGCLTLDAITGCQSLVELNQ